MTTKRSKLDDDKRKQLTIPVIVCDMNGRMTGGVMLSLSEWLNVMLPTQRREDA